MEAVIDTEKQRSVLFLESSSLRSQMRTERVESENPRSMSSGAPRAI